MTPRTVVRYPWRSKVHFYLKYGLYKVLLLWLDVRTPKVRAFVFEMLHVLSRLIRYRDMLPAPFRIHFIETKFGKFKLRPFTSDMILASPAFEREDLTHLLELMDNWLKEGKRTLFLDVGANLGTYSVAVGNRFRSADGLQAVAFEPAASSFDLLVENLRLNGLLGKVQPQQIALYREDRKRRDLYFRPASPGSSSLGSREADRGAIKETVLTRTLDSVLAESRISFDYLLIKIDVEGLERAVIEGAITTLSNAVRAVLLVEDFTGNEVVTYLESKGAIFLRKLSPYNSWWLWFPNVSSDNAVVPQP